MDATGPMPEACGTFLIIATPRDSLNGRFGLDYVCPQSQSPPSKPYKFVKSTPYAGFSEDLGFLCVSATPW
jgi:hypothetical protein